MVRLMTLPRSYCDSKFLSKHKQMMSMELSVELPEEERANGSRALPPVLIVVLVIKIGEPYTNGRSKQGMAQQLQLTVVGGYELIRATVKKQMEKLVTSFGRKTARSC